MKNFFTKFLAGIVTGLIFFSSSNVSAHEIFWYDRDVGFDHFERVVIFPLSNAWESQNNYRRGEEGTRNFKLNAYLEERLSKKLDKVLFIRLAEEIHELDEITTQRYENLLAPFPDEESRAAAVEEALMADAYIVPRFRENRVQVDTSPRREWDIQLSSWTEITGGPNGNETLNEKSRMEHFVLPEMKIYLHCMTVEFTGYDKNAKKILTSVQQNRSYNVNEEGQFKNLVKDFQEVFGDAKKGKNTGKKTSGGIRIGFTPVTMEGEFKEDAHYANAMTYAFQDEAIKNIKGAKIIVSENNPLPVQYFLRSSVESCRLIPVWHEPSYSVNTNLVSLEERKWRDKDGKEHTMTISRYDQNISGHYAYYSFYWAVTANFWLVDPQNSVVISRGYQETDDKPIDAYRHAAEDFCDRVNKRLKG